MIRFSVIIPHKGPQWQLDRCVASIPQRDDLQTIVIHDEEGRGAGWARNQGLSQAEGSYVIFADSDDYFHPCFNDFLDSIKEETARRGILPRATAATSSADQTRLAIMNSSMSPS